MSNPKQRPHLSDKSLVIEKYLQGKSMNQIARETGISKGKVHYLINDWKNKIGASDIDEIREFVGLSRKSNISIEQCAQGFRMMNILKNLGIENGDIATDDDDDNNDIVDNNRDGNNNNYKELSTFIEDIYKNCKKLNIQPAIIPSWIKDLLDFNFSISYSSSSSYSNNEGSFSLIDIDEKENDIDDKRQISSIKIEDATKDFLKDTNKRFDFNLDNDTKSDLFIKDITSDLNLKPTIDNSSSSSSSSSEIKIPFISQVSFYIDHKKKELVNLTSHQKNIEKDIQKLEVEKSTVIDNLNLVTRKEKHIISYIEFFYNLEKELWSNYSIKIKDDIQGFSQLINDFREHGYDALEIIKEYLKSLSIKLDIKTYEANIESLQNQRIDLNNSVLSLESQVGLHKQTMDIYSQLQIMKLGFKEIKQLWLTILEIAKANNISHQEAVSRFLKDVEEQYDTKLGFESKVQEKRDELALLNKEINNNRQILRVSPFIGSTLSNLFQKGMGEQDIIGINQLLELHTNNNISFSSAGPNKDDENIFKDNRKEISTNNRSEYWKLLTEELKKYGGIKFAMKDQLEKRDKLQKEVIDLNKQKQENLAFLQLAISFINTINQRISYCKGCLDQYNNINNKINLSSRLSDPLPIFIICDNTEKEKNDGEETKEDEINKRI
ncbi:MAG: hypothetical protein ABJB76_04275 [Candidatus Nitrosocosmicus sp.]